MTMSNVLLDWDLRNTPQLIQKSSVSEPQRQSCSDIARLCERQAQTTRHDLDDRKAAMVASDRHEWCHETRGVPRENEKTSEKRVFYSTPPDVINVNCTMCRDRNEYRWFRHSGSVQHGPGVVSSRTGKACALPKRQGNLLLIFLSSAVNFANVSFADLRR